MKTNTSNVVNGNLELTQVVRWLVSDGLVHQDKIDMVLSMAKNAISSAEKGEHPFTYITQRSWDNIQKPGNKISMDDLMQWLAAKAKMQCVRIDPLKINVQEVTAVISLSYAQFFNILPIKMTPTVVVVATAEPFQQGWKQEVARITGKAVQTVLANPTDLKRYIVDFYNVANSVIGAKKQGIEQETTLGNFEQLMELSRRGELDSNDHHVVSIVEWLLQYAFEQRASDIHLEPRREKGNVRFRIDGVMQQVYEVPALVMNAVSSRIKILARMNIAEKRRPQDGRIKTRDPDHNEIELRLSTMPTAFGEKLVMRIFDPQVLQLSYSQLGFSSQHEKIWAQLISQPNGLILVTGPTGSGKTSTLYTTLRQLAKPEVNVCTVEDPIEMIEPVFNQMQVHEQIDLTFASGIRTLLRQDPDIIMVGEIRDQDTADMAIQASLTGHLVLSTLHTNDTLSAVVRLMDIGIPAYLMHTCLLGIMAQRLVRTLCPHCKQKSEVDKTVWQELLQYSNLTMPETIYTAKGCIRCRSTGYMGRTGIYEMLPITNAMKSLIKTSTDINELYAQANKENYQSLKINGIQKVIEGNTTLEEVFRVTPEPGLIKGE